MWKNFCTVYPCTPLELVFLMIRPGRRRKPLRHFLFQIRNEFCIQMDCTAVCSSVTLRSRSILMIWKKVSSLTLHTCERKIMLGGIFSDSAMVHSEGLAHIRGTIHFKIKNT